MFPIDIAQPHIHNVNTHPTVEETVEQYRKSSEKYLQDIRKDPQKDKAFLLKAGIIVRSKTTPPGLQLAKKYRSSE